MITLDAGVLIALFDAADAHHAAAEEIIATHLDDGFAVGPVTEAEILVRAVTERRDDQLVADLSALGVSVIEPPPDAGQRLARLRASTRAKMPDCCVLLTAQQAGGPVATFDLALRRAARGLGIAIVK